jgi:hypothetical protein
VIWRLIVCVLLCGCTQPHWSDARTDLDRVPLSAFSTGDQLFVVGGPLGSAGNALFLRHDSAWHELAVNTTSTLWWVHGFSASDVYAVGENGAIAHYDGSSVTLESSPTTATLFGIWGSSSDDLWIVGGQPDISGTLWHKQNGSWQEVTGLSNTGSYFKVWGSAADDVWVCGQSGTILHYDGTKWSPQTTGVAQNISLFTVNGRSRDDVYSVGGLGNAVALHFVGGSWQPLSTPVLAEAPALAGVAVAPDGKVTMVGASGTKIRDGHDESQQATRADYHAVAVQGSQLWVVGGNWLAPAPTDRHGVIVHYGD